MACELRERPIKINRGAEYIRLADTSSDEGASAVTDASKPCLV